MVIDWAVGMHHSLIEVDVYMVAIHVIQLMFLAQGSIRHARYRAKIQINPGQVSAMMTFRSTNCDQFGFILKDCDHACTSHRLGVRFVIPLAVPTAWDNAHDCHQLGYPVVMLLNFLPVWDHATGSHGLGIPTVIQ